MKLSYKIKLLIGTALFFPSTYVWTQITSGVLYCCINDQKQMVCSDKRSLCWGRATTGFNREGIPVEKIPPPKTAQERFDEMQKEKEQAAAAKKKEEEELHFQSLLNVYGSPEAIDREIQRQEKESEANIKITESRLQTAKNNVTTCENKLARNEKSGDCNDQLLISYRQTVTDIESEIVTRKKQTEETKQRLLASKREIEDYQKSLNQEQIKNFQ